MIGSMGALAVPASPAHAKTTAAEEENKRIVLEFWTSGLAQGPEVARSYIGPVYIQHNSRVADGPEGLLGSPDEPPRA